MVADVDFVLESPSTGKVLLVEAKSTNAPSTEWAGKLARGLLSDTATREGVFFLLVLRNSLYLWKHIPREDSDPPDYQAPTAEALRPYLEKLRTPLNEMYGAVFETLVSWWLNDVSAGSVPPSVEKWLRQAGLQEFENGVLREEQRN